MPTDREKLADRPRDTGIECGICGANVAAFENEMCCHCRSVDWVFPTETLALPDTEPQGDDEPIVTEAMIEAGELELPHAYGRKKAAEIVTRIYKKMRAAATGGAKA